VPLIDVVNVEGGDLQQVVDINAFPGTDRVIEFDLEDGPSWV
jgi:hypothetical protein